MPFSLSVHHLADLERLSDPAQCESVVSLFLDRLGSGGQIYDFWHLPAVELGLPLLSNLYEKGLTLSGDQLESISIELDRLESHWKATEAGCGQSKECSATT